MKCRAQRIHRKDIRVGVGGNIRRRAWPVVLLSEVKVVFHLQSEGTAGLAGVLRKLRHIAADVVHTPMRKRGGGIEKDHHEGLCSPGSARPGELWRLIT